VVLVASAVLELEMGDQVEKRSPTVPQRHCSATFYRVLIPRVVGVKWLMR
jgi:hypothetical protein